jgi:BMFP domain-containing protein YqiC
MDERTRLSQLEARLADLEARLPAHSVRPAMLMELEDLEGEIARLRAQPQQESEGNAQSPA